ncbi:MAG: CPBP family intramembrane glutamic endopeptidase [Planctomycetota bacterium]|nr:CPBP family intramembrane glutamic endopeptidase [Planctomycetota bacterium]
MESTESKVSAAQWPLLIFALLFPTLLTWVYFILLAKEPEVTQQLAFSIGKGIQFALPLVWVYFRNPARFGFPPRSLRGVGEGIVFGLIVGAAMLIAYHWWLKPGGYFVAAAAEVNAKVQGLGAGTPVRFLFMALFYCVVHSLLEEYYWRWFVFGELRQVQRWPIAAVVSGIGFTAHHVLVIGMYFGWSSPLTVLFSLAVTIGGIYWAWLYQRSGSLLGPWVSHLLIDGAIFVVGWDLLNLVN